LNPGPGENFFS